jgi:hypothetical protein
VCQFSINNCFYSDLYEKNDSAKLAIPLTNPFQEGKIKATFAHVAKPPAVHRSKGAKAAKRAPTKGFRHKPIRDGIKKTLMDQIHLRRL